MVTLRPYQQRGAGDLRQVFAAGKRAPLYVAPTGSGKTALFSYIASNAAAKGRTVLILVHRQELIGQTSRGLAEIGVHHALIASKSVATAVARSHITELGRCMVTPASRVFVASVQTLVRRKNLPIDPDLIVPDEGHHVVPGNTWDTIIKRFTRARILGVTATPIRGDGQGLGVEYGGVYDELVIGPTPQELIDEGYLTATELYRPPTQVDTAGVRRRGGDWMASDLAQRVDKPTITGDAVDHYSRICPGAPTIVFCASVKHAEHVAAQFREAGYSFHSLDGSMDDTERRRLIRSLGDGSIQGLTSCEIISEGTDIPVVTCAILLRKTDSLGLYLQQVGRVLRPVYAPGHDLGTREGRLAAIAASDKPAAIILDHVGNSMGGHGLPEQDREWTLAGERGDMRRKKGEDATPVRQCPKCYRVHPAAMKACPQCGHVHEIQAPTPEQVDGELQRVTADERERIKEEAARQRRREEGRAAGLEDLAQLGAQRGYKPGWAVNRWLARHPGADRAAAWATVRDVYRQCQEAA